MAVDLKDAIILMGKNVVLFIKEISLVYSPNQDYRYEIGKKIPRIGRAKIGDEAVRYRFHGNGCPFWRNGDEIFFKYDYSFDQNKVWFTPGSVHVFCKTYIPGYTNSDLEMNLEKSLVSLKGADFLSEIDAFFSFYIIM